MSRSYRDEELEDFLCQCAFVYWTMGALPVDYQMKLLDYGVDPDWVALMCLQFHPLETKTKH